MARLAFWALTGILYARAVLGWVGEKERIVASREVCQDREIEFLDVPSSQMNGTITLYKHFPHAAMTSVHPHTAARRLKMKEFVRIYEHETTLSLTMLEQGVSSAGDLTDVRRIIRKASSGLPIKVVFVGGSVTWGHGPVSKANTYVNQIFDWLQTTFPHPDNQLMNHAIPAATSAFVNPCIRDLVPEDTDLVFLEFTFNDSERGTKHLEDPGLRSTERLLRKLKQMESHPGVVWLHFWPARYYEHNFTNTEEDALNTLLKFYGMTGLSVRDALHQQYERDENFVNDLFQPKGHRDRVHPTCVGSRFVADLVIGWLQNLAAGEVTATQSLYTEEKDDVHLLGPSQDGPSRPLQKDNWGNLTEQCILDQTAFRQLVQPIQGFNWTNEGRGSKWGFVGTEPGSTLNISVPTAGFSGAMTIGLGFLISYQHMGIALLQCIEGCECRPKEYSFQHPNKVSITSWRTVRAKISHGSQTCIVGVTISDKTRSKPPEHKVKLSAIMTTEEKDFILPYLYCDDCLQ